LWVGEAAGEEEARTGKPFVGGAGSWLNSMCRNARVSRANTSIINTIGCKPPENVYPADPKWEKAVQHHFRKELEGLEKRLLKAEKKNIPEAAALRAEYEQAKEALPTKTSTNKDGREAVAYCYEHHLHPALDGRKWSRVVALGDWALQSLTEQKRILQWRGSPLPLKGRVDEGPRVVPTLHPAYLARNTNLFSVAVGDLRKGVALPPENYVLYPTIDQVRAFTSREFAFDFEWDSWGNITLCGLSDRYYHAVVVPWCYPFTEELKRIFENALVLIGHNIIGADTKYFEKLGWNVQAEMLDTMLMQHLVQPDMRHTLAFVASVFTGKVFWKGHGEEQEDEDGNFLPVGAQWKTWNSFKAIPREFGGYGGCESADEAFRLYNARDTDGTFQCVGPLKGLLKRYEMEGVYRNVSVPAGYICRDIAEAGLKVDRSKVGEIRDSLEEQIVELEAKLPAGLRPYEVEITKQAPAPPGTYKPKTKKCKGSRKLGTAHDSVEMVFSRPGSAACRVCDAVLTCESLQELKKVKVLATKRVVPWNSTQQVIRYAKDQGCKVVLHAKTGNETGDKNARKRWGREHTEFAIVDGLKKLATERNSFAKPALLKQERVYFNLLVHGTGEGRLSSSGRRKGIDPNIQNQPKTIRKLFVPDHPDWGILACDLVQGENMLTTWLAKDWERWERINAPGFNEHRHMASIYFNTPIEQITKNHPLYKAGKIINHGRNYGMGKRKVLEKMVEEGINCYNESDVGEMIEIWKKENPGTARWQQQTIEVAQRQGYLANPFGRRRWFQSRDFATKSLAFLPASTLADCVLRMMIALYPARFPREVEELRLAVVGTYPKDWRLCIQVHDELTSQGPHETHIEAARVVEAVMTQPWRELEGFRFKVDTSYSIESWGECKALDTLAQAA
jgi:DNA polymerase I-like protein with 3'-5' exonuclease and polymerase domains/uracil-DNA glycosylase